MITKIKICFTNQPIPNNINIAAVLFKLILSSESNDDYMSCQHIYCKNVKVIKSFREIK